ncbi:MAG: hypothetical protein NZ895_02625 [Archaeoglobaceae archaeon]|nr:hypothetical protein [Archaeoglobaceae archaeon]MCX8151813.1 hypothetical protein [Archaeoglobaceae archaeon]MDW8014355.1 hypothetical protein [Archaeoglobaceae archaeon]
MDIETRTSILMDAFNELKKRWINVAFKEEGEEIPESRVKDLFEIREKYQLNDVEFLFIVGTALGFYQGQKMAYEEFNRKLSVVNEFVSSLIGKKI